MKKSLIIILLLFPILAIAQAKDSTSIKTKALKDSTTIQIVQIQLTAEAEQQMQGLLFEKQLLQERMKSIDERINQWYVLILSFNKISPPDITDSNIRLGQLLLKVRVKQPPAIQPKNKK